MNFIVNTIGKTLNFASLFNTKSASSKALKLFSTPRKGRYNEHQKEFINSGVFKELYFNTYKIATYHWEGSGKTILLAHGWESNSYRWHYILEDLRNENYNIFALDAPAHGNSSSKTFNAVLYADFINEVAKSVNPDVIIGHSVGGMATVFSTYLNTISAEKIILLGAPADFTGVFARYKTMMGFNKKISNGLDSIVLERFNNPVSYYSSAEFSKSITAKGLIIHDKEDLIIPYEDGVALSKSMKDAIFVSTSGFGHGLKDKSLTPKIIDFINS